jgi:hypothetical protein
MEFCPVCMLRKGLVGGVASGESSEEVVKPTPELPAQRFEHYELVTGEDGTSVELGRGSMGVTYKAFDIDLRWQTILARLRRARLLAGEDPQNPGHLDTHPLVREYFGEQLRSQRSEAWKECNRRLFHYYQTLAPQLPNRFREMEPLFSAVTCGCEAGLFREALHEVYIPRIQRGNDSFAANVLGARGPLLSALIHFFEDGRWGSFSETKIEGQSLSAEDQLFILMQAAKYLTATQGAAAQEARICYERGSWTAITTDGRFASHRHFFPTKRRGRS